MQEQRMTFEIEGMTCGGCARAVANAIRDVPGVKEANVDLQGKEAVVQGDSMDSDQVVKAVNEAGFSAKVK